MDAQDKAAPEVQFDLRAGGVPFSGHGPEREFDELHGVAGIAAADRAASPGDEGLVGKTAVAAECGGTAATRFEFSEQPGLVLIGVT